MDLFSPPGLMRSDVPRAEHRLVALARLETFVRYAKVLQVSMCYAVVATHPSGAPSVADHVMFLPC